MKSAPFDYVRAESVEDAYALLARRDGECRVIAGGQSLVPMMAMRLARPELLIDIGRLEALSGIERRGDAVVVRACTTQTAALADSTVRENVPLLAQALAWTGHPQTRNRGTVGGSLAHADPSAEIGLVAVTLGAEVMVQSLRGARRIAAGDFLLDAMTTPLEPDELLTEAAFPVWNDGLAVGSTFREVSRRHSDFAIVAAAAQAAFDADGVCRRLVLGVGGASGAPMALTEIAERLVGSRLEERDLAEAERLTQSALDPQSDPHATAAYRRQAAGTLVRQALQEARRVAQPEAAA
jgi:CO/xanthine dehydrogenase FAD-binding subunit